jgi:mannose-6-phosphate isomerase-like protein (cupin superfamily)
MKTEVLQSKFENGNTHLLTNSISNIDKSWNPHTKFQGVYLKNLITGDQTNNRFSSLIVRIDPGCALDTHVHEGRTELHEVMEGSGICFLGGNEIHYLPGDCAVIPDDTMHKVIAGSDGMIIHAKFVPAL